MKKLLCMLLVAMMLLGCAAFAEAVDYVGLWNLTGAEVGGAPIDMSLIGLSMSMDLRQDNTCTLTTMGEAEEGTWTEDATGLVVTDSYGEPMVFAMVDGKLEATQDGMKIIFARAGDAASYVGVWVMTGMVIEGVEMSPDTMAMFGMALTMTLNADGTCVVDGMGATDSGTWQATANGVAITDPTETLEFTYANDMLIMDDGRTQMLLTREGAAPAITEAAEPVAMSGVPAEAFEGKWTLATAVLFGMELTAEEAGTFIDLDLLAGKGIYTEKEAMSEALALPITYTVTEAEGEPTVLTLIYQDETMEEPAELMTLNMLDDGRLSYVMNLEGIEVGYFFEPVVEEVPAE